MRLSDLIYICCFLYQKVKVGLSKFIHIYCLLGYRKIKFRGNIVWLDATLLPPFKESESGTTHCLESMSKSNLLPSFSESGSEIESKFVQLNRYTLNTIHFLSQTVKFTLVHFLRVHPSTSFLILESESGSSLGPTWSIFVTFLPKKWEWRCTFFVFPLVWVDPQLSL